MQNRWNDADAAALDGLGLPVYASRLVGADTSLVVWGGGNTSIKTVERDHRGREQRVLRVKGSGSDLKSIRRQDFPGVRMDDTCSPCSSATTWVTRRWSTTCASPSRSPVARGRPSRRCCTASCPRRR